MKAVRSTIGTCIALLSLALTACSNNNLQELPQPMPNPLEETLDAAALTLEGVDENALNPSDTVLAFSILTATFDATPNDVRILINAKSVDTAKISVGASQITAAVQLDEGRNDIVFNAYDMVGRPVYLQKTVWAGGNKLVVRVVAADGSPVPDGTDVRLRLSDNLDVMAAVKTVAGGAVFSNVPTRTVIAEARTDKNGTGMVGAVGDDGTVTVRLVRFNTPDSTAKNDVSQARAGSQYGSRAVVLVPHVEQAGLQPGGAPLPSVKRLQRAH